MTVDATSTLNLSGNFKTPDLGTLAIAPSLGSRVRVTGVWDNSGQSFTFNTSCTLGEDFLGGGIISGGTLDFVDGARLLVAQGVGGGGKFSQLTGVVVNGDLVLNTPDSRLLIGTGTTFRTAYLSAPGSEIDFPPGYTLTGAVVIENSPIGEPRVSMNGNAGTLVIGPTGIIRTGSQGGVTVSSGRGAMTLVNQGLISSQSTYTRYVFGIAVASFTNSGIVEAINGGILHCYGGYTQTAGVTRVAGGTIGCLIGDVIQIDGGTLEGYGSIGANVSASGIIDPKFGSYFASGPGLAIRDDLTLGTDAELRISIGGTTKGTEYDFLSEAGSVPLKLDGTLKLDFANGFERTITSANTFTILTSNQNLTGTFDNVKSGTRLNTADGFGSFVVTYSGQSVVLSNFVPEPGAAVFCAAAGILLLSRRSKSLHSRA
jgi:hypothetical protein